MRESLCAKTDPKNLSITKQYRPNDSQQLECLMECEISLRSLEILVFAFFIIACLLTRLLDTTWVWKQMTEKGQTSQRKG